MREAEIRAALEEMFDDDEERKVQETHFFADQFPPQIRSVCVVGGGTVGYLTAIALKSAFPDLEVILVEATDVPIIGVGEATVDNFPRFLQGLGLDIVELYRDVRPTWKLGIRFDWGPTRRFLLQRAVCLEPPWNRTDRVIALRAHHQCHEPALDLDAQRTDVGV